MINLYEFLGIAPTNDLSVIQAAINKAEQAGKDAKLVQACKSYLLKPDWKAKHDSHFGLKNLGVVVEPRKVSSVRQGIADLSMPIDRMKVRHYVQIRQAHVEKLIAAEQNPYQFNLDEADLIQQHMQNWTEDEKAKFNELFVQELNAMTESLNFEAEKVMQKAAQTNEWAWVISIIVFVLIMYAVFK